MSATTMLIDHDAVRDWVAARAGSPAIREGSMAIDSEPVLHIVFGQRAYDNDQVERTDATGGLGLVDWDEWFAIFDERQLALVVPEDRPGVRDEFHEIVRRFSPGD